MCDLLFTSKKVLYIFSLESTYTHYIVVQQLCQTEQHSLGSTGKEV